MNKIGHFNQQIVPLLSLRKIFIRHLVKITHLQILNKRNQLKNNHLKLAEQTIGNL